MEEMVDAHELVQIEKNLFNSEVRKNPEKLAEFLDEDFSGINDSGWVNVNGDVFKYGTEEAEPEFVFDEMSTNDFNGEFAHLFYRLDVKEDGYKSRRSSVWKKDGDEWKLYFHQATVVL